MELESADSVLDTMRLQPQAPAFHGRTFGDDVGQFASDLSAPGFGRTGANVRAGFTSGIENDLPMGISDDWVMAKQYEPIIEAINKVQNRQPRGWLTDGNELKNPYSGGAKLDQAHSLDYLWSQVDAERARNPGIFGQLPKNHAEVLADAQAEQRAAMAYAHNLNEHSGPVTGTAAQFVGGIGASAFDPINIAATVAGFPAAEGFLKKALIETAGNMAVTGIEEPGRVQHAADLGEPMTAGDIAMDLGASGAFGFGVASAGHVIGKVLGLGGHDLVREFNAAYPEPTPTQRTAAAMVEDGADLRASNPFSDDVPGIAQHEQAVTQAAAALDDRDPGALPDYSAHVEAAAREADPQAFADFEAAANEREALRTQLDQLAGERQAAPAVAEAQARIDTILGKISGVESRLTKAQNERLTQARADLDAATTADTPAMAAVRQQIQQADIRMRDTGPRIAIAMKAAKAKVPEPAPRPVSPVAQIAADHAQHVRGHDPENLKLFTDPVKKPKAFKRQAEDLAREIAPPPEAPLVPKEGEAAKPSPYGEAEPQIAALDRLPQDDLVPMREGVTSLKSITDDAKRQARAVERLRGCITGGE